MTDSEAVVGDFADACPLKRLDGQSDAREHSFDLSIKPFGDTDFDERAFMSPFEYFYGGVRGFALGQPDTLIKFFDVFALDSALHLGDVCPGQSISWVRQAVDQFVIVGEDNQPCGIDIEPANAKDSLAGGYEVDCLGSALRVKIGANHALWLIEEEINLWLGLDSLACRDDCVFVEVRERGDGVYDLAIDRDESFEDEFLAFSP